MRRNRTADRPLVVYGANPVLEVLRSSHPVTSVHLGPGPRARELAVAARARGITVVEEADRGALARRAGSPHHQGAVAIAPPFRYAPLDRLLPQECRSALLLDGVQDPRNLGAIIRTARAAGLDGVVLPHDRSVGVTGVVAVTSAGLVFGLTVVRVPNLVRAMLALKDAGYWLVGLAPGAPESLADLEPPQRVAVVLGGEGEGLRPLVRRACDFVTSIPMAPGVDSLNVAVAAGIALYALVKPPRRAS
ncbi:MAG: 23S rRNA (guanosine(2251)-2'-O)-methyltransferase RlmB [Candidatus Rokubacteria bacterium 13_1_40CM_2_68_13]|nr:MAG: 23S rRNA (guanosine(2251)-2'-O)-methyltransferase RlmB [Candidatus Rokubacteria bacterium 13_1_40CM_2_68_13]